MLCHKKRHVTILNNLTGHLENLDNFHNLVYKDYLCIRTRIDNFIQV